MELGAYSFGDTQLSPDGAHQSTSEAIKTFSTLSSTPTTSDWITLASVNTTP